MSRFLRRRIRTVRVVAGVAAFAALVAGLGSMPGISSASSVTASSLLASMSRELAAQQSVRLEGQQTYISPCGIGSSTARVDYVTDATASSGRYEMVIQDEGQEGKEVVLDDNHIAFVYADAFALQRFNCFSSKLVKAIQDRWVFAVPTNPNYSTLVAELTMPSIVKGTSWHNGRLLPKLATVFGQRAYEVQQVTSVNGVKYTLDLYIRTVGPSLPIQVVTSSKYEVSVQAFTRWGEQVEVSEPHGAMSLP